MKRIVLTPRPRAPVLVRATAIGTLALAPLGCGDDEGGTASDSAADVAPTAGPCAHDPNSFECGSTGLTPMTASGTSTGSASVADSATDVAPTAGPCAHNPDTPGCASSTGTDGSDTGTSGTGSGSGSGTGSSSGTGTAG